MAQFNASPLVPTKATRIQIIFVCSQAMQDLLLNYICLPLSSTLHVITSGERHEQQHFKNID